MRTVSDTRRPRSGPRATRGVAGAVLAVGALLLASCAGAGDEATVAEGAGVAATPSSDATGESASTADVAGPPAPIVGEFQAVDPGVWSVDTLGVPVVLELVGDWFVQPNHAGITVLTDPDSRGPADRDVVLFRPSDLIDPDAVTSSLEELEGQEGWPLDDIHGWLERVPAGLVDGDPVDTSLGGRDAVRFVVDVATDFPCGPSFCAGFITSAWTDSIAFERSESRVVYWVDGGDHEPLVVLVGRDAGGEAWLETAEALLDTVELGEPGPHPIGEDGPLAQGLPGDVSAGDTVETPRLGGLRFVVPADGSIYQAPGVVVIEGDGEPTEILLTRAVETLDGEPIETVDVVVDLIRDATVALEEVSPTTIAGHEARVLDYTGERSGEPRPGDAVFRLEPDGIGGWGPVGEGRAWLLDTAQGILLLSAGVHEPGDADLAEVIAQAEATFATLELVGTGG